MIIQDWYLCGDVYDEQKEIPSRIIEVLRDIYGPHIASIIKIYLPIFYDENSCVKYYLINKEGMNANDVKDVEIIQNDGEFNQYFS